VGRQYERVEAVEPLVSNATHPLSVKRLSSLVHAALREADPFERSLAMAMLFGETAETAHNYCDVSAAPKRTKATLERQGQASPVTDAVPCRVLVRQMVKEMTAAANTRGAYWLCSEPFAPFFQPLTHCQVLMEEEANRIRLSASEHAPAAAAGAVAGGAAWIDKHYRRGGPWTIPERLPSRLVGSLARSSSCHTAAGASGSMQVVDTAGSLLR